MLGDVPRRLDAEHRNASFDEVPEQISVVRGHLDDEALGPERRGVRPSAPRTPARARATCRSTTRSRRTRRRSPPGSPTPRAARASSSRRRRHAADSAAPGGRAARPSDTRSRSGCEPRSTTECRSGAAHDRQRDYHRGGRPRRQPMSARAPCPSSQSSSRMRLSRSESMQCQKLSWRNAISWPSRCEPLEADALPHSVLVEVLADAGLEHEEPAVDPVVEAGAASRRTRRPCHPRTPSGRSETAAGRRSWSRASRASGGSRRALRGRCPRRRRRTSS